MAEQQLDLFSDASLGLGHPLQSPRMGRWLVAADSGIEGLDDAALVAAIPESSLSDSSMLAAEAGRRRLAAAIPALAALCRRFAGFGIDRAVPEQAAALQALAMIGGRDAAHAGTPITRPTRGGGPRFKDAPRAPRPRRWRRC